MVSHSYSFLYACVLCANGQIVGTVWTYTSKMTTARSEECEEIRPQEIIVKEKTPL